MHWLTATWGAAAQLTWRRRLLRRPREGLGRCHRWVNHPRLHHRLPHAPVLLQLRSSHAGVCLPQGRPSPPGCLPALAETSLVHQQLKEGRQNFASPQGPVPAVSRLGDPLLSSSRDSLMRAGQIMERIMGRAVHGESVDHAQEGQSVHAAATTAVFSSLLLLSCSSGPARHITSTSQSAAQSSACPACPRKCRRERISKAATLNNR